MKPHEELTWKAEALVERIKNDPQVADMFAPTQEESKDTDNAEGGITIPVKPVEGLDTKGR